MIALLLAGGYGTVVHARARRLALAETAEAARLHAETLAGLLDVGSDGVEFEAGAERLGEFRRPGSGAYAVITGPEGRIVVRSPSLGERSLPPPPAWERGLFRCEEIDGGPDGSHGALAVLAFTAPAAPPEGDWKPPPEEQRRFRISVFLDTAERDRDLASLSGFLVLAGSAALVAALGAGLLLAGILLRPLQSMTREAAALRPEDPALRLRPDTVVEELHELAGTLNGALDRLGEALERQRRFTADAGHELRTPVAVLLANAEHLLRRPRTDEQYRAGLEREVATIRRMKDVVENLLALARTDAGAGEGPRGPVRLAELLDEVCRELEPLAAEKGVALAREAGGDPVVPGDRRGLARLLGNLVINAIKFTPAAGAVTVRAEASGGGAEIVVSDTGPGIPPEHRSRIFERFHRVHEGRDGAEGAGLGLAIADGIARSHGGAISVEARPGGGTTLRVRLPAEGPVHVLEGGAPALPAKPSPA